LAPRISDTIFGNAAGTTSQQKNIKRCTVSYRRSRWHRVGDASPVTIEPPQHAPSDSDVSGFDELIRQNL
jgi:hypothetical protein